AGYDAIVIATGSVPRRDGYTTLRPDHDGIEGADRPRVLCVDDVFHRPETISGSVLVVGHDPHLARTAAAGKVAERGVTVSIVTPHMHAGADLPVHHAPALYRRLASLGITVTPSTFVTSIGKDTVTLQDRFTGAETVLDHAGSVVLAMGNRVND